MSLADELQKLNGLKESGVISEEEYQRAKESLLTQNRPTQPVVAIDANTWGILIHLSQFLAFLIPLAGIIAPVLIWQLKKNESPLLDQHGKIVINWLLTEFIFGLVTAVLCVVLIGIPLLIILAAVGIIFPIIGAIKAADGKLWPYPFSIRFFN